MSNRLHTLFREIPEALRGGLPDVTITAVTADSRRVVPGALFVAITGVNVDGHRFLSEAVERGAVAAVGERPDPGLTIPYLRVPDSRWTYAHLAAAWHGYPARRLVMIGVTGTDGKTTTASLIFRILRQSGLEAGLISTVYARIGGQTVDTGFHVTTPDALDLQAYLRRMLDAGLTHCVLEVTSHGLAQHRVAACAFDLAVVTNITHEHLDYHGSYEAYRRAKGTLFAALGEKSEKVNGPTPTAVLNRDDESYAYLVGTTPARHVTYGLTGQAMVRAGRVSSGPSGLAFTVHGPDYEVPVASRLLGDHNVANILAATATAVDGLGIPPEVAAQGIASLEGIPGRMELIDLGQPFTAIVDFAHTPNALRRALETARGLTDGRVIAVFGSAGLRDREKRHTMAAVSARLADLTVLTAEDPRTESLEAILEEMAEGARSEGGEEGVTFWRVPDRGEAMRFATAQAWPGDLVIACGKGHEQSMCFGETEYPWDDRLALRAALAERLGIEGLRMPRLPTSR